MQILNQIAILEKRSKKWRKIRVTKEEFWEDLDEAKEPRRVIIWREKSQRNFTGQIKGSTANPSYRQRINRWLVKRGEALTPAILWVKLGSVLNATVKTSYFTVNPLSCLVGCWHKFFRIRVRLCVSFGIIIRLSRVSKAYIKTCILLY